MNDVSSSPFVYVGMPLMYDRAFGCVIGHDARRGVCVVKFQNGDVLTCAEELAVQCAAHLAHVLAVHVA